MWLVRRLFINYKLRTKKKIIVSQKFNLKKKNWWKKTKISEITISRNKPTWIYKSEKKSMHLNSISYSYVKRFKDFYLCDNFIFNFEELKMLYSIQDAMY